MALKPMSALASRREIARDLRHVLEPPFAEHLQHLPVPLVVLLRGDAVLRRIDLRDFVAVGEIRHDDDDRLLPDASIAARAASPSARVSSRSA